MERRVSYEVEQFARDKWLVDAIAECKAEAEARCGRRAWVP